MFAERFLESWYLGGAGGGGVGSRGEAQEPRAAVGGGAAGEGG